MIAVPGPLSRVAHRSFRAGLFTFEVMPPPMDIPTLSPQRRQGKESNERRLDPSLLRPAEPPPSGIGRGDSLQVCAILARSPPVAESFFPWMSSRSNVVYQPRSRLFILSLGALHPLLLFFRLVLQKWCSPYILNFLFLLRV
jgi:hypothetical protein